MTSSRGFSLIELIVTISVMLILAMLAVANIRSTQANGRDEERKTDIDVITRGLERRYIEGNPKVTAPTYVTKGSYPGTNEIQHAQGTAVSGFTPGQITGGYLTSLLPGTTDNSFKTPGSSTMSFGLWCTSSCTGYSSGSVTATMASINTYTTTSKYTYSPVDRNNNICYTGDCVRFFLYYRREVDGQLYTIKSKNQ